MDIGNTLKQAREARGLTLDAAASATRIPRAALDAIERNDMAALPGGLFTRGYLRAYAAFVGANPGDIVAEYLTKSAPPAGHDELADLRRRIVKPDERHALLRAAPAFGAAALLAGALAAIVIARHPRLPSAGAATASSSAARAPVSPPVPAPDRAAVQRQATPQEPATVTIDPKPAGWPAKIEISVRRECWVTAIADGRKVIFELMPAGRVAVIDAREAIELHVGDADALAYWINGVPGRPIGGPGEVVTVQITEENYRGFLGETMS